MDIAARQEAFEVPLHVHAHLQLTQIAPNARVSSSFIIVCRDHYPNKRCHDHRAVEKVVSYSNAGILEGGMVEPGLTTLGSPAKKRQASGFSYLLAINLKVKF